MVYPSDLLSLGPLWIIKVITADCILVTFYKVSDLIDGNGMGYPIRDPSFLFNKNRAVIGFDKIVRIFVIGIGN